MKTLQELSIDERLTLLTAISSGAITELTDKNQFTFDIDEAESNTDLIPLGNAQTIKYEILTFDEGNLSKPFKSLKTGINYTMEEINSNEDDSLKYVYRDQESLYQAVELFQFVVKSFNSK